MALPRGGPGRALRGKGSCLFEWRSRDRAVTSPALPGLAPAEPEAKTSSASAWPRAGWAPAPRSAVRPAPVESPGTRPAPLSRPGGEEEGRARRQPRAGGAASGRQSGRRALPPASPPPRRAPSPRPSRRPERKAASCALAHTCAPSLVSSSPAGGQQSPKEKRLTCPVSHGWGRGDRVEGSLK